MKSNFTFIAALFILAIGQVSCTRSLDRQHIEVLGRIELLQNNMLVLPVPEPLRTPNNWNALCIQPDAPYSLAQNLPAGVRGSTGDTFRPLVRLRNNAGEEDSFDQAGNSGGIDGMWLCFEPGSKNQILHSPYSFVVITSPEAITIKAIRWHSSDK